MATLKKLDMKSLDYIKTEKTKKEVEKLESQMMVALQAIETTSAEIIKLRETQLYPELLELVKGLVFFSHTLILMLLKCRLVSYCLHKINQVASPSHIKGAKRCYRSLAAHIWLLNRYFQIRMCLTRMFSSI